MTETSPEEKSPRSQYLSVANKLKAQLKQFIKVLPENEAKKSKAATEHLQEITDEISFINKNKATPAKYLSLVKSRSAELNEVIDQITKYKTSSTKTKTKTKTSSAKTKKSVPRQFEPEDFDSDSEEYTPNPSFLSNID